ncbi:MFS transporter [Megasphaera sueciensis]|uniref:MFS transporter n=1 Tax=Megasphaera sueciensis TaxID=349094 RepID=UPI003CFBE795
MESNKYNVDTAVLFRKRQMHVILPVFLVSVIAYVDRVNVAYAGMTMTKDLPWLGPEVFGAGAGIFFLSYFIFEIPGTLLAEKFDACKWIARIMITWGAVCGLMAFMNSEFQFYLFRFLLGMCEASLYPTCYAILFRRWFLPEERAKAISMMLTSLLVSAIIGAPFAGWLLELSFFGLHGWQTLFIIEALPAIIFAFVFMFWVKDRPEKSQWLTDDEKAYMIELLAKEEEKKNEAQKYTVMQALTDSKVLRFVVIYVLWMTGFWGFNFWMPQVIKNLSGWSPMVVGFAFAIPLMLALIAQLIVGGHSSKTGEKKWHITWTLFLGAIGLGVAPLVHDPTISLIFVCIAGIGCYSALGVWWATPTSFLSGAAAAGAVALINSTGNLGGYIGPYLLGVVKANTGSTDIGFYILAGCLGLAGILMATMKPVTPDKTQNKE